MLSLTDTTQLLDRTTSQLIAETEPLTPQAGLALIDSWIDSLQQGENTRPLAQQLTHLKALLEARPVDGPAVQAALGPLVEHLSLLATDMGGEGEMPSLLEVLATALRQAAGRLRTDTAEAV